MIAALELHLDPSAPVGGRVVGLDLKCDLREQLLEWVHVQHPGALPRMRTAAAYCRLDRELVLS